MLTVADLFVISLAIVSTQGGVSVHNPFYCYSEDPIRQWTGLGGIHSPYEPNRGKLIDANVSACSPSKFWMTSRHGARYPFARELPDLIRVVNAVHSQILENYNQGRTSLCASDFQLLRNWQFNPNVTMDVADELSDSGWNEMKALAERYQTAFPTILPSTYSPNDYMFQTSDFQRTRDSVYAFAEGLFGENGYEKIQFEDIPEPDVYLRPFVVCTNYTDIVTRIQVEQEAFIEGPEYQEMIMQVSAKLGFLNSNVLRNSEVALLALHCKYEQMWNLNYTYPSPFCAAFSVANAQVIEYSQDVDWYYRIGYGKPEYRRLYENLMCFTLQDMLRFIQSNDVNDHQARIFNGHTQRVWRSTDMLPMAANLAVIRYDCADGDNDLLFLFNEKPLQIELGFGFRIKSEFLF